jgi:hypothetical protein
MLDVGCQPPHVLPITPPLSVAEGPFEPFTTDKALIFEQTTAESADGFTFAGNSWQLRVATALVWRHQ